MMAGIRGKDTKPEVFVRRSLHAAGYRFRLHSKVLPGRPDIVLPRYRTVIFVNGCFWHGHEHCRLFRLPKSRQEFWQGKIASNKTRDALKTLELQKAGWKVITIWECALKGRTAFGSKDLVLQIEEGLSGPELSCNIRGEPDQEERLHG